MPPENNKPEFNPNQSFQALPISGKPEFDMTQPFESAPNFADRPPSASELEAIARAESQLIPFHANMGAGAQASYHKLFDNPQDQSYMDLYNKYKDAIQKNDQASQEEHPYLTAGTKLGTLGLAGVTGALGLLPSVSFGAPGGVAATALDAAGNAGLYGAAQGAENVDYSKSDIDLSPIIHGYGSGALTGGVLGAGMGMVSKALNPNSLEKYAASKVLQATGGKAGQREAMLNAPVENEDSLNRVLEHGANELEPNEYTEKPPVAFADSSSDILAKNEQLLKGSGESIGKRLKLADEQFNPQDTNNLYPDPQNPTNNAYVDPSKIANEVEDLQKQYLSKKLDKEGNPVAFSLARLKYQKLQEALNDINSFGDKPISFEDAHALKNLVKKEAYDPATGKMIDKDMANVYSIVDDNIEKAMDTNAKFLGNPDDYTKYLKDKDLYRSAKDAVRMGTGQEAREMGYRDLGLTDTIFAAGELATGHPGRAIAMIAGNKLYGKYAAASEAVTAQGTANLMRNVNKAFTKIPNLKQAGTALSSSNNPLAQKLGNILINAAEKDDIGRNAVIYSLMQQPAYRELMLKQASESPEE